jgi:uncharacterized protein YraI
MRYPRLGLSGLVGVLMVAVVVLSGQIPGAPSAQAQEGTGTQCEQLTSLALSETGSVCGGLGRGEACFGHAGVTVTGSGSASFAAPGDTVTLGGIDSLATVGADPATGDWGVARLMLPAGLPGDSAVTAVLFGDAQIARPVQVEADRPTLTVYNRSSAPINLRNGAGVNYNMVGQLEADAEAVADGRNEQADWVRIQFQDGVAWVFTPLIGWDGDQNALTALEILLPNDVTPAFQSTGEPFEAFTLSTGPSGCDAAPSGLLLQYAGEQAARLQVNQVSVEFADATVLVTSTPNDALEVKVLSGAVTATARGIPQEAVVGGAVRVILGGEDGLTPTAAPFALRSYAFPDVAFAPLGLLPGSMACMVGLPSATADVQLRVGPGTQRGALGRMNANLVYAVIGRTNDPDGAPWWQLDTGEQPTWAPQAEVRAIGACDAVAEVEPPPLVFAPPTGGEGGSPAVADLAPDANSVWQMRPGTDNMSGQCSGAPAINFCDHLAAIAPASGGLTWRGMEASPYYLVQIQPNVYAYAGPNVLGTGQIKLTLSFTSETELKMTMSLVLSSEPDCTHIYYYSGSRNW